MRKRSEEKKRERERESTCLQSQDISLAVPVARDSTASVSRVHRTLDETEFSDLSYFRLVIFREFREITRKVMRTE